MQIQLLTFADCPNAGPAREALREAVQLASPGSAIEEIDISAAAAPAWTKGWGSPTILVDGIDVAGGQPAPSGGAIACRFYPGGVPTVEQLRARLAGGPAPSRRWSLPVIGGLAAAVAASACCLVPAALAVVGVSGAGVASSLAPLRPYFLVATGGALAAAFWFAYRREPSVDACGCATPRSRRRMRLGVWLSTVLTVGIAGYPLVFDTDAATAAHARGIATTQLRITGMDCRSCTKVIAKSLARVPGVATVDIDYDRGVAEVTHDGKSDLGKQLIDAVENVGFDAEVVR